MSVDGEEYDLLSQIADDRTFSNPEQQVLQRELRAHLLRALTELTPRERIIFELKHYQGLRLRTMGEILNCSEASIKTSLFRATRKLRLHLTRSYLRNCSRSDVVMSVT